MVSGFAFVFDDGLMMKRGEGFYEEGGKVLSVSLCERVRSDGEVVLWFCFLCVFFCLAVCRNETSKGAEEEKEKKGTAATRASGSVVLCSRWLFSTN